MGYQEMIYNYLGSGKDYIDKMNIPVRMSYAYPTR
jgi:hypothetical protein